MHSNLNIGQQQRQLKSNKKPTDHHFEILNSQNNNSFMRWFYFCFEFGCDAFEKSHTASYLLPDQTVTHPQSIAGFNSNMYFDCLLPISSSIPKPNPKFTDSKLHVTQFHLQFNNVSRFSFFDARLWIYRMAFGQFEHRSKTFSILWLWPKYLSSARQCVCVWEREREWFCVHCYNCNDISNFA